MCCSPLFSWALYLFDPIFVPFMSNAGLRDAPVNSDAGRSNLPMDSVTCLPFPQMYHLQLPDLVQVELPLKLQVPPLPQCKAQALHLEMLKPSDLKLKLANVLLMKPFQATSPLVRSSIDFTQQELLLEKPKIM